MQSSIGFEMPKEQLFNKKNYEPLLLECLNRILFFIEKSGGGFSAPKTESSGQCDAIGKNGCYSIDFKLLVSQEGAKNVDYISLAEEVLCEGVTIKVCSEAFSRGELSVQFPSIWGFLASHSFSQNENSEIVLSDKTDKHMGKTVKILNKIICTKKNLLFFHSGRLVIQGPHDTPMEVLCNRAKEALSIVSKARRELSSGYETYYALLMNSKMVLLSEDFTHKGCVELNSLAAWNKLHIKL